MLYRYLEKNPACVFALIAITLLSGCANYQLGDYAPLPFRTLYILPAVNDSFAPLAVSTVSAEIREAFIRDGRVKLVAKEENADAVLTIRLTEYERSAVTRDTEDTFRARDFNIRFSALLSLYNQTSGDDFFRNRRITASTNAYVGNPYGGTETARFDYSQAENLAMPRLAKDLARQAASTVLSNW